ncbi:MAG: hypothetical protein ACRDRI_04970 [Pseudonocardiaceae bacterium]
MQVGARVTDNARAEMTKEDDGHPAWCSAGHCFITDEGVRVHEQAPVSWEDDDAEIRVESRLVDPTDDPDVYLRLYLMSMRLPANGFHGLMPVTTARRLRDQLTAHLDAVK